MELCSWALELVIEIKNRLKAEFWFHDFSCVDVIVYLADIWTNAVKELLNGIFSVHVLI